MTDETNPTGTTAQEPSGTVTIDGKKYQASDLSEDARNHVVNLRVTDQEIQSLKTRLAIAQTARVAYARALSDALPMDKGTPSEH